MMRITTARAAVAAGRWSSSSSSKRVSKRVGSSKSSSKSSKKVGSSRQEDGEAVAVSKRTAATT
jgi:hypothetical protein